MYMLKVFCDCPTPPNVTADFAGLTSEDDESYLWFFSPEEDEMFLDLLYDFTAFSGFVLM